MDKSEYLYKTIKLVYTPMVQSTLAIENYFGNTISAFNKQTLKFYNEFLNYYDEANKHFNDSVAMDAALMCHLRRSHEKDTMHILKYIETNIINKIDVSYEIYDKYRYYQNDNNEKNPFQRIIIDLRKLEENIFEGKEVSSLHKVNIVWYDEETLAELRNTRIDETNEDGELGGHLMQNNVSYDLSYLSTREEREKLFREIVLGETPNAN